MTAAEHWVYDNLKPTATSGAARTFRVFHHLALVFGVVATVAVTHPEIEAAHRGLVTMVVAFAVAVFSVEYVARLYGAAAAPTAEPTHPWVARLYYARSLAGLIDLAAVLPFAVAWLFRWGGPETDLFAVVWVLKLFRYSPGAGMLRRVLRDAREGLLSVFTAFLVVLLLAATLIHVIEGPAQPNLYGSIPHALWWTIVTLTTTGYGDFVPVTPFGRLLASVVMVCGIGVFALWAGILASAFANEVRRREFLRNWDMISRVPFFRNLGSATITDIAHILKPQELERGRTIIRRGDPGDCMYFIVSGDVEVSLPGVLEHLGPGDFFGEIALITGEPRSATAKAESPVQLLVLDIADFRDLTSRRPELARVVTQEAERRIEADKEAVAAK